LLKKIVIFNNFFNNLHAVLAHHRREVLLAQDHLVDRVEAVFLSGGERVLALLTEETSQMEEQVVNFTHPGIASEFALTASTVWAKFAEPFIHHLSIFIYLYYNFIKIYITV
jgi:hypothetical protein